MGVLSTKEDLDDVAVWGGGRRQKRRLREGSRSTERKKQLQINHYLPCFHTAIELLHGVQ
jgi:hypothetical protein